MDIIADSGAISANRVRVNTSEFDKALGGDLKNSQSLFDWLDEHLTNVASNDKNYIHTQTTLSATWTVTHRLNKKPNVEIFTETSGVSTLTLTDYRNIDNDTTVIYFGTPTIGYAVFN